MERPSQEIGGNTAMVTIPASPIDNGTCALIGSYTTFLTINVKAILAIDGHGHAVLLLPRRYATLPGVAWKTASATLHDPRQAERYPCFVVLIAAIGRSGGRRWPCLMVLFLGVQGQIAKESR
jgi:hypothetical protein